VYGLFVKEVLEFAKQCLILFFSNTLISSTRMIELSYKTDTG